MKLKTSSKKHVKLLRCITKTRKYHLCLGYHLYRILNRSADLMLTLRGCIYPPTIVAMLFVSLMGLAGYLLFFYLLLYAEPTFLLSWSLKLRYLTPAKQGKASSAAAEAACNSFIKLSQAWLKTQLYNDIDFKDLISFLFSTPSRISAELVGDLKGTQEMFDIGTSSIAGGLLFRVNISRTPHSVIRKFLCQRKIRDTKETNKPKRPKQKKDNESQTQDDGDRKAFKRVDFLQVLPLELLVKIFNSVTDINTFMGLRLVCKMSMEVLNQIPIPPLVLYTAVCLGGDRIFAVTKEGRAEEITRFRWAGDDSYAGRVGPYTADGDFDERTLEVVWHCFFPGDFLLLLTDGIYNNLWKHVPKSSENTFKRRILRGLQRLIDKLPRPLTPESIAKSLARHAILNTKLAREQVANGSRAEIECGYLDHSTCLVLQI
eukprot:TRINITY_DN1209_c0_g1_i2.p1 TRINITY_DN1209_c0_g1~~TRINITY_DN1209_c0_g1_i2.p1  ORF type:complete len:431 (-),score=22.13 TRINITY_DN1209_c0_g1_i2:25-1317(-)